MKIVYDIKNIVPYRGGRNKKVFIYVDGILNGYLWMSDDDLQKNIAKDKKDGDCAELVKSYLDKDSKK